MPNDNANIPYDLRTRYNLAKAQLSILPPVPETGEDTYAGIRWQCNEVIELIERISTTVQECGHHISLRCAESENIKSYCELCYRLDSLQRIEVERNALQQTVMALRRELGEDIVENDASIADRAIFFPEDDYDGKLQNGD